MNFSNSNLQLYRINTFNKNKIIKYIVSVILLLITVSTFAQQGINYKALIKDGSGNVLASAPVSIQFIIYEGVALTNNVYQESHTVNTDANGIVIVNIGQGSTSDVFANINWGVDQHFLNVQVNTGSGLVDMGTTEFMSVPYAKHADIAKTATNVAGLEKITEGANTGWRLVGRNPANYGDIGFDAVDLSSSDSASTTKGATGAGSLAMGVNTTASNSVSTAMGYLTTASYYYATAMGRETKASNWYSTAMGYLTTASGTSSTAMGESTTASGYFTTAMGNNTTANALASTAIGRYNIGGGSTFLWTLTDPLFEIGNGTSSSNLSNALTVLKNGTIIAPSFDLAEITNAKALITKEYADTNLTPTGLEKITENFKTGWRLIGRNSAYYGDIGVGAIDLSRSNTTSNTLGATGYYSLTIGSNTIASGDNSMAMGFGTKAEAFASAAFGKYNIGGGNPALWADTDPLFEIGNGTSNVARSNALTVLKNGNTDVNGVFRATGKIWPTTGAGVEIAYDSSLNKGYIQSYDRDISAWRDIVLGAFDVYPVNDNYTNLGITTNRWTAVYAVNGTIQTSDRRLKKEINDITYGLNTVMKLRPVSYKWKKGNQNLNLGLIAQDVQKLIPEVVDVGDDKDKTLGMKYTELIPVLISAMQEQQNIIEQQKTKNQQLRAELSTQNKSIENLLKRMDALEASNQ